MSKKQNSRNYRGAHRGKPRQASGALSSGICNEHNRGPTSSARRPRKSDFATESDIRNWRTERARITAVEVEVSSSGRVARALGDTIDPDVVLTAFEDTRGLDR